MKTVNGIITLVQEHRFQLEEEDGRHRLFILAHDAAQQWRDLERLEREHAPVTVHYADAGGLIASAAHDIEQQPEQQPRPQPASLH